MTYDEVVEAIGRGRKDDWRLVEASLIYKHDLHLRIEAAIEDARSGTTFSEPWVDDIASGEPPMRVVYGVHYGVSKIMEIHTVWVGGRTIVPLPDRKDRFYIDRWQYSFGKIIELYTNTELDAVLASAGIEVRDTA